MYKLNVGKLQYHSDTTCTCTYRVGEDYTPLDGATRTPSPRRAAATVGCAVSPGNFGQAEPKRTEHVAGSQSWSKIAQNGEYRRPR